MFKIDFVVTWVDGSDPNWIEEKNRYSTGAGVGKKGMNSVKAFREWGTFKYWFRGVQKFAPWVNKVYLVTYNQKPQWINNFSDKLRIIDHSEFLDHNNLPVFSSNPIEVNLHRIKGLSEHFVIFNDDMYLTAPTRPTDFFSEEGLPKYTTSIAPIIPERYGTGNFQVNDMEIITDHFSRKVILKNGHFFSWRQGIKNIIKTLMYKNSKYICGFSENHLPYPMLKTTMDKVWKKERKVLMNTSSSKFRSKSDVNIWLFKYWQIASGNYAVGNPDLGKLFTLDNAGPKLWDLINSGKYQIMCINDGFDVKNEELTMNEFISSFEKLFPEKSEYEK